MQLLFGMYIYIGTYIHLHTHICIMLDKKKLFD